MKISQIDYSAMMSANSAAMAAETNAQNNRAIAMSDSINKMNQRNIERTADLQAKAQEIQASANQANAIANVINAGLNVVSSGVNIYSAIKQAKIENDTAAWNLSKLQNVTDFQTLIATADNLGSFNDQGKFKISDEITNFINKVVTDIKTSDWTKDVKDLAIQEWAQIGSAASVSIAQEYGARQKESKATLESLQLQQIQKAEIIGGTGYDAGYKFINSLSYDDTTKEALKLDYKMGVDEGRRQETALATLSTSGYNAARDYVNNLTGITEAERRNLLSTVSTAYENQMAQEAPAAGNYWDDCIANGMTAAEARDAVMEHTGANSQDSDFQQAIKKIIDTKQIAWAAEQYQAYGQLDYLTEPELDLLYESIEQDEKGVFVGIENTQQTMLATIDDKRIAYDSALLGKAKEILTAEETNFDNTGASAVSLYKAGYISASTAVADIEAAMLDVTQDFVNSYGALLADGTITQEQYDAAEEAFIARLDKSKDALLLQCVVANVPAQFQDYVKSSITDMLYKHFDDKAFDKLPEDKQKEWKRLEADAMLKAIEYTKSTATGDMSIKQWDEFMTNLGEEVLYGKVALIADIAAKEKTLVTEKADNSLDYGNQEKVRELAYGAENAIYENPNGGFEFTRSDWEAVYNQEAENLGKELARRGIVNAEESSKILTQPMRDANGDLVPIPTITVDNTVYSLQPNSDGSFSVYYADDDGYWHYLPYEQQKPQVSTAPEEDGFPKGPAGDMLRSMFKTAEDWRNGIPTIV